jgi:hypothetical protein
VSVYSEMLRLALAAEEPEAYSVAELVSRAVTAQAHLHAGHDSATRLANSLAYDVALVRLCERLGVEHELAGESAGPIARRNAEMLLLEHMPSLADVMALG